jgi:hypothetical protein
MKKTGSTENIEKSLFSSNSSAPLGGGLFGKLQSDQVEAKKPSLGFLGKKPSTNNLFGGFEKLAEQPKEDTSSKSVDKLSEE